jgi:RNA ligase
MLDQIEAIYQNGRDLDRKSFAIANKDHPLFGLAMQRYLGKEVTLLDWYGRTRLKDEFSLRVLANDTLADALEGGAVRAASTLGTAASRAPENISVALCR